MDHAALPDREAIEAVEGVHLTLLAAGDRTNMQHFHIEPGAEVPEHSHHHEQIGFVYEGALTFRLEDGEYTVEAGESFALASREPHAAVNPGDGPVKGVDIFSPPRTDPDWMD